MYVSEVYMIYEEILNTKLSSGRNVRLECSYSVHDKELNEFTIKIADDNALKFADSELEECNLIAQRRADSIATML
jgi:hypothetical protein